MLIDCDTCTAGASACADCVISAITITTRPGLPANALTSIESDAVDLLVERGMAAPRVAVARVWLPAPQRRQEAG